VIDCEEDRTLRAVLVGMLREAERAHWPTATQRRTPSPAVEPKNLGIDPLGAPRVLSQNEPNWREDLRNRGDRRGAGNRGGGSSRIDSFRRSS
jgi:hypothetical protein